MSEELSAKFANEPRMGEGGQYKKKLMEELTVMWNAASDNVPVYRKKLGVSHVVYTAGSPVTDAEAATSSSSTGAGGVASVGVGNTESSPAVALGLGEGVSSRLPCGFYLILLLPVFSLFGVTRYGDVGKDKVLNNVATFLLFSPVLCMGLSIIILLLLVFHAIVRGMKTRGWRAVCMVYIASFVALPVGIGLYVGTSNGKLGGVNVNAYRSGYICGKEPPTREDIAARGNISTCLDVQDLLWYGKNLCLQAGGLDKPAVWCNEEDDSFRSHYLWWSPCDKCGTGTAWRIFTSIDNDNDQSWYKRPTSPQPNKTDSPPDDGWLRWESSHNEWFEFDDDAVNITTCSMILPELEATNISISEGARYDIPSSCFSDRISFIQQNPWNRAGYILLWIGGICWWITFCTITFPPDGEDEDGGSKFHLIIVVLHFHQQLTFHITDLIIRVKGRG